MTEGAATTKWYCEARGITSEYDGDVVWGESAGSEVEARASALRLCDQVMKQCQVSHCWSALAEGRSPL